MAHRVHRNSSTLSSFPKRPGSALRRTGCSVLLIAALLLAAPVSHGAEAFDRWLHLAQAQNFRDVGGYDVGATSMVAIGRVFRSAHLFGVTTTDVLVIQARGIRRIVDLRTSIEVTSYPDSVLLDSFTSHTYIPVALGGNTMPLIYQNLVVFRGPQWNQVFHVLTNRAFLPLDYHCQAGQDRTGVMTALLLTSLGVDRETVIADYLLTNEAYGPGSAQREWIEAALDEVQLRGGIDAYLDSIGTTESVRRAVRANLLVRRPVTCAAPYWQLYR